jgi:precorrin-2 methylase
VLPVGLFFCLGVIMSRERYEILRLKLQLAAAKAKGISALLFELEAQADKTPIRESLQRIEEATRKRELAKKAFADADKAVVAEKERHALTISSVKDVFMEQNKGLYEQLDEANAEIMAIETTQEFVEMVGRYSLHYR